MFAAGRKPPLCYSNGAANQSPTPEANNPNPRRLAERETKCCRPGQVGQAKPADCRLLAALNPDGTPPAQFKPDKNNIQLASARPAHNTHSQVESEPDYRRPVGQSGASEAEQRPALSRQQQQQLPGPATPAKAPAAASPDFVSDPQLGPDEAKAKTTRRCACSIETTKQSDTRAKYPTTQKGVPGNDIWPGQQPNQSVENRGQHLKNQLNLLCCPRKQLMTQTHWASLLCTNSTRPINQLTQSVKSINMSTTRKYPKFD